MRLDDKAALVVGAGKGIGRAIAVRFAQEGALVVVGDLEWSFADNVAERIDPKKKKAVPVKVDVTVEQEVEALFQEALERFGKIDTVVNCAGVRKDSPFHLLTEKEWDAALSVNLKGGYHCAHAAERHMVERRQGSVVLFASPVPFGVTGKGQAHYCAANAGVMGLTQALAVELGGYNIRVNCICPDYIDTDMTRESARRAGLYLDDFKKLVQAQVPLRRMGRPEEVANLALFLASDESAFITGQVIHVKGGP